MATTQQPVQDPIVVSQDPAVSEPPDEPAPPIPPPSTPPQNEPSIRKQSGYAAAVLVCVIPLAVLGWGAYRSVQAVRPGAEVAQGGCAKAPPVGGPGAQPSKAVTSTLKLQEGQLTRVDFGRSVSVKTVTVYLNLSGTVATPTTPLYNRVGTFRRADDGRLNERNIVANVVIAGRTAILTVCFGRVDDRLGDPGTYNGSVTIDDARLSAAVTIPFTLTMQYPHPWVAGWLFLALLPGTWVLWIVHTSRQPTRQALDLRRLRRWLFSVEGVVSVATGAVAAASVFIATYLRDPTWGSSSLQPITLFGAMFAAFTTTAGLTQITNMAAIKSETAGLTT